MEERLDDAIHVLRNHAEAGQPLGGMPPLPPSAALPQPHSNGLLAPPPGAPPYPPGLGMHGAVIDSHMVSSANTRHR